MSKVYEPQIDPEEFIRTFRDEPSGLSSLKRKARPNSKNRLTHSRWQAKVTVQAPEIPLYRLKIPKGNGCIWNASCAICVICGRKINSKCRKSILNLSGRYAGYYSTRRKGRSAPSKPISTMCLQRILRNSQILSTLFYNPTHSQQS